MGKKNRIAAAAAAAAASNNRLIQNLKTVNFHLEMDAAESLKQIEQLSFQLTSMAAEHEIFQAAERDAMILVLSSSLKEAAARTEVEMAEATERERNLRKKIESVVDEINDAEMRLLSMIKYNKEKKKDLEELKESLQQDKERGKQRWKKWLYSSAAANVTLMAAFAVAVVTFCCKGLFARSQT